MKVTLAFVLMISLTVIANIFMKLGGMVPVHERTFSMVDWRTIVGMGAFGLAGCVYAWILTFLPLNIAQSFASAQFVAVILASTVVLTETIPPVRWVGISFIFLGILIVAMSDGLAGNG